jgi:hypothetical protein
MVLMVKGPKSVEELVAGTEVVLSEEVELVADVVALVAEVVEVSAEVVAEVSAEVVAEVPVEVTLLVAAEEVPALELTKETALEEVVVPQEAKLTRSKVEAKTNPVFFINGFLSTSY